MVRELTGGAELEAGYTKKRGTILAESKHTVTFFPHCEELIKGLVEEGRFQTTSLLPGLHSHRPERRTRPGTASTINGNKKSHQPQKKS